MPEDKRVSLPYGRGQVTFTIPENRLRAVLAVPHEEGGEPDQQAIVRRALEHPIGSAPVSELARGKRHILLITSDHTRPVPSRVTLPIYLEELRKGAPDAEIRILIATGMHRPTTREEMIDKFGEEIVARETIVNHVSSRMQDMTFKGILPSGGELWINNLVDWAELVVSEGFIEPHFFAGFSGGRKSILPGIASEKTVLYNHNSRFLASPRAVQGSLQGNPIHEDMLFAAHQAGLKFILNVLIDEQKRVIDAYAGDLDQAHAAGCARSLQRTAVDAVEADIAITSNGGYPLDQNVYQSVKGMTAAEATVRQDGVIIMCAALGDGAGGDSFYHWFADRKDSHEVAADIEKIPPEATIPDQWEAQMLARVQNRARCIFLTGEENRKLVEDMHMTWAGTPEEALALAEQLVGRDASVTVVPYGVGVIVKR